MTKFNALKAARTPLAITLFSSLTLLMTACGTPGSATSSSSSSVVQSSSSSSSTPPVVLLDGVALFDLYCANCHKANDMGTNGPGGDITGETAADIQFHIDLIPAMAHLSFLTDAQIDALAVVLVRDESLTPSLDGAALFEQYCGACHKGNGMGRGSVHDVTNHGAAEIAREIKSVPAMQDLSFLTPAQIDAIAAALKKSGSTFSF